MNNASSGERLGEFWFSKQWKSRWEAEIARRALGLTMTVDEHYCFHTNPLFSPTSAMSFTAGRYRAAFDVLAEIKPHSVLEIGCAHGLGAWLMKDFASEVVGVDILETRIAIGRHLFPEIELVAQDFTDYLTSLRGRRFDVMVCSHGPTRLPENVFDYCDHYIWIGYRPRSWRDAISGAHKLRGRQISHSTTLLGKGMTGLSPRYWRYFLTRDYLMTARHCLTHGYALPL